MSVMYILLPTAVVMVIAAMAAFIWAVKSGQYDDLETPKHRAIFDDDDTN